MFPVIMYDGKTPLPDNENIFYVIAKGGIYIYKDLNTVRSLTKVNAISFLKELKEFADLKYPIIPKEILGQAVAYFRHVYNDCKSESGLVLDFFPETNKFVLHCPNQEVSSGKVEWDNEKELIPKGALRMCSIHSHARMSAFHSTTDKDDEKFFDGLHITIGHLDENIHSIVASVVVNGNRFPLDEDSMSNYLELDIIPIDSNCVNVSSETPTYAPIYEDYQPIISVKHNQCDITVPPVSVKLKKWKGYSKNPTYIGDERRFTLDVLESNLNFPEEWKTKFTHKAPKNYRWDSRLNRLVEINYDKYNCYNNHDNYCGDYDWSKWNVIDDNDNKGYPLIHSPHSKNDPVEYIPSKDKETSCKLYPVTGNCDRCIYKEMARNATDQGIYDQDDVLEYLNQGFSDEGMDPIIDEDYYGCHVSDDGSYELGYDEKGNMIDPDGNIINILSPEDDDHIESILSPRDYLDHK